MKAKVHYGELIHIIDYGDVLQIVPATCDPVPRPVLEMPQCPECVGGELNMDIVKETLFCSCGWSA